MSSHHMTSLGSIGVGRGARHFLRSAGALIGAITGAVLAHMSVSQMAESASTELSFMWAITGLVAAAFSACMIHLALVAALTAWVNVTGAHTVAGRSALRILRVIAPKTARTIIVASTSTGYALAVMTSGVQASHTASPHDHASVSIPQDHAPAALISSHDDEEQDEAGAPLHSIEDLEAELTPLTPDRKRAPSDEPAVELPPIGWGATPLETPRLEDDTPSTPPTPPVSEEPDAHEPAPGPAHEDTANPHERAEGSGKDEHSEPAPTMSPDAHDELEGDSGTSQQAQPEPSASHPVEDSQQVTPHGFGWGTGSPSSEAEPRASTDGDEPTSTHAPHSSSGSAAPLGPSLEKAIEALSLQDPHAHAHMRTGSHITVERGDTLWGIAEATLESRGDATDPASIAHLVTSIADANDSITDPDLIHPGQQLTIPHR